jgi:anti-sigma regulatory factor (Ser/Thr protein kinase)
MGAAEGAAWPVPGPYRNVAEVVMTAVPFTALAPARVRRSRSGADDAAGFATFPLGQAPGAPCTARNLTRATLTGWGREDVLDDALVVVSELVTNALRYGRPAPGGQLPPAPATHDQPFLLSLVHCDGSVLCAVFDPGRDEPRVKEPDFFQESGRGLHVLASLAADWGWTTPDRNGKTVWALLAPESGRDAGADDEQEAGWDPMTRLLLLLELLSGPSWLRALGDSASTRGAVSARRPA